MKPYHHSETLKSFPSCLPIIVLYCYLCLLINCSEMFLNSCNHQQSTEMCNCSFNRFYITRHYHLSTMKDNIHEVDKIEQLPLSLRIYNSTSIASHLQSTINQCQLENNNLGVTILLNDINNYKLVGFQDLKYHLEKILAFTIDTLNYYEIEYFLREISIKYLNCILVVMNSENIDSFMSITSYFHLTNHSWLSHEVQFIIIGLMNDLNLSLDSAKRCKRLSTNDQQTSLYKRPLSSSLSLYHTTQKNKIIKVVTVLDEPFVYKIPHQHVLGYHYKKELLCPDNSVICRFYSNSSWEFECCSGLVIEIFLQIIQMYNFKYEVYIAPDGKYGGQDINGTWNGIIHDVMVGKADIGIQAITVSESRLKVVDFTAHVMESAFGVTMNSETKQQPLINWSWAKSVAADALIFFIGTLLSALTLIFGYENIVRKFEGKSYYPFSESVVYVMGLAFQRDIAGVNPSKWSSRLVAILQAMAMTIFMANYTANLLASNVLTQEIETFDGLQDPKITDPSLGFVIAVRKDTNVESFFKDNAYEKYREVYNNLHLLTGNRSGVDYVYEGSIDAYIDDYIYSSYRIKTPTYCQKLVIYKDDTFQNSVAFAVQKNSTLKQLFSTAIIDFKETNKIDRIIKRYYYQPSCNTFEWRGYKFPWQYAFGFIIIMLVTLAFCGFVLVLEFRLVHSQLLGLKTNTNQNKLT